MYLYNATLTLVFRHNVAIAGPGEIVVFIAQAQTDAKKCI